MDTLKKVTRRPVQVFHTGHIVLDRDGSSDVTAGDIKSLFFFFWRSVPFSNEVFFFTPSFFSVGPRVRTPSAKAEWRLFAFLFNTSRETAPPCETPSAAVHCARATSNRVFLLAAPAGCRCHLCVSVHFPMTANIHPTEVPNLTEAFFSPRQKKKKKHFEELQVEPEQILTPFGRVTRLSNCACPSPLRPTCDSGGTGPRSGQGGSPSGAAQGYSAEVFY